MPRYIKIPQVLRFDILDTCKFFRDCGNRSLEEMGTLD